MTTLKDIKKMSNTALQIYFNLTNLWGLSEDQERILLGYDSTSSFVQLKGNHSTSIIEEETILRISHLMGIHKCLQTLLPSDKSVYKWVHKNNDYHLFHGETALSYMLGGGLNEIKNVRMYLESQCH